jgi:hypothetical protein
VGFARRRVPLKAVLLVYIAMRCVLLATMENPEQRYTMMVFPMLFLAGGCALAGRGRGREQIAALETRASATLSQGGRIGGE